MSKILENINTLIAELPDKDISLGYKFLKERDFESLFDLVNSAIYKVKKSLNSGHPKEEYKDIKLEALNNLQIELDSYTLYLDFKYANYEDLEPIENNNQYE